MGIELRVVAQDVKHGTEYIRGLPPLKPIRIVRLGGMLDTVAGCFVGPSKRPVRWYIGERQAEILLRRDPSRSRTLLYSAEGGGKTVLMAMWLIVQIVTLIQLGEPGAIGATAPTHERLQTLVKAIGERVPVDSAKKPKAGAWFTYYTEEREFRCPSGHVIQCRSTKKQSEATGSPIQGFTWKASGDDELQDTVENGADPDIEARLRGAQFSYRMATATAKDSPGWRTFRDSKLSSPDWVIERLNYLETPFAWLDHWQRMQRNMSLREWKRRGLAQDVGPERQLYYNWERDRNLRPVPAIGAVDITRAILAPWGQNYSVLVGYDPGASVHASILFKAYRLQGWNEPHWWIVDEVVTPQATTEQHAVELRNRLQTKWKCQLVDSKGRFLMESSRALVRADPYSDSGNDSQHPDRSVYKIFANAGFDIRPATYARNGTTSGQVPVLAGIEMVNSLFCNAVGESRLYMACDDRRQPAAPRCLESLELSERGPDEKPVKAKKGSAYDLSHYHDPIRYALWQLEKPTVRQAVKVA